MKKIIISGGSGLIGKSLSIFLANEGNQISWLSRKKGNSKFQTKIWNPRNSSIDITALTEKDVLIQFSGSNIADERWSDKRKKDIIESRIKAIQTLYANLKKNQIRIPKIIQASAMGYYGDHGSEMISEKSSPLNGGFLSEVCKIWEAEAFSLKEFTDHFTIIRTGLYLSPEGGIWPKLIQTKKFGFLIYFGNGSQIYSWIHYLDFNRAISFILNNNLNGIVNLTSPNPVSNKNLILEINHQLRNKVIQFGIPVPIIKCLLGELSQAVLCSANVLPKVLISNKFQFAFEKLDDAVKDLLETKTVIEFRSEL